MRTGELYHYMDEIYTGHDDLFYLILGVSGELCSTLRIYVGERGSTLIFDKDNWSINFLESDGMMELVA